MSKATTYNQDDLVEMIRQGHQKGFSILYDRYSPALYGIAFKISGSDEAAKDILQDSMVKIWKNIDSFNKNNGTLFTWMLNIVRNKAIDHTRSKHVRYKNQIDEQIVNNIEVRSSTQDDIGVNEAVEKMDGDQKMILDMIYIQGFTQQEAANALGLPLGTVKTRARAAIRSLRNLLNE